MAKGLPKWAIKEARARGAKNVFAYAWTLVKRKGKKGSRKFNPKIKRRGGVKVARRKKRSYRRSLTIPLAPVMGMTVPLFNKGIHPDSPVGYALKGDWNGAARGLITNFTGFNPNDGSWEIQRVIPNITPIIAGLLVHKFVGGSPLNLNRILARNRVPFIRI